MRVFKVFDRARGHYLTNSSGTENWKKIATAYNAARAISASRRSMNFEDLEIQTVEITEHVCATILAEDHYLELRKAIKAKQLKQKQKEKQQKLNERKKKYLAIKAEFGEYPRMPTDG